MNSDTLDPGLAKQDSNALRHSRMLLKVGAFLLKVFVTLPFNINKKLSGVQHKYTLPGWLDNAVFYQIYPQSFKDTNGDGIGDIQGIIDKLDYLKDLGVDALWLNPLFDSPFNDAGYDVRDFKKVAERYGSNDDLKRLFDEAKKKGIRVVLDLVAGHCSDEHEWFKASSNNETTIDNDHFIWTKTKLIPERPKMVKSRHQRKGYYQKNFYDSQPALNYGYGMRIPFAKWEQPIDAPGPKATRQALKDIIEHWMEMGASGFRVDMAQSLVKRDFGYPKTMKIWREIRNWFEEKWPEGVLISEWGLPDASVMSGFHIDFMLPWTTQGVAEMTHNETGTYPMGDCYFDKQGRGSAHKLIKNFLDQRNKTSGHGLVSLPTANHDFQRPSCGSRTSTDELKAMMLYYLTFSDLPIVYYGDEIGMKYTEGLSNKEGSRLLGRFNRAGARTPMQWDNSENAGFSSSDPASLYLPVDSSSDYPNVEDQQEDSESLLNFSKALIQIKKSSQAFTRHAQITFLSGNKKNEYPLVYVRKTGSEQWMVVINPTGQSRSVTLYQNQRLDSADLKIGRGISIDKNSIQCAPVSYGLYKMGQA